MSQDVAQSDNAASNDQLVQNSSQNGGSTPPQSEFDMLLAQLKDNPHQPIKWRRVVDIAQGSGETEKIRTAYEALLQQYPNTAAAQIAYIEHYLSQPRTFLESAQEAESLFKRWVKSSPSVELFRFYLTYIRRIHADPTRRDPEKRETIRKAYEFALNPPHGIGQDKDSGDIWLDYIQFLSEADTTTTWDAQQNMDALRKVYHRAVQIPLDNVERLWQDLESFEMKLNRITAQKFMSDLSPAHMQARTVYRQLMIHVTGLYPPATGQNAQDMYLPTLPTFNQEDRALVGRWKAYLKWEESNPLEIEEKDRPFLILRLQTVYRKAVVRMRYYSEIWFLAYSWTRSVGKKDEAMNILKNGREANPLSHLLTYAYADALELDKRYKEVEEVYDAFLPRLAADLDATEERIKAAAASNGVNGNGEATNSSQSSQDSDGKSRDNDELLEKRQEYSLAYINYMRFIKRINGVMAARLIFKRARVDKRITWHVYEASAMIEYHCGPDKQIPTNIFVKANSDYGTDVEFVVRYLNYLLSIGDEKNARTLFEESTQKFTPDVGRPIWERWAKYEYQYGDLEASLKLEKRMAEVFPNDPPIKRFAMRHIHLNIDAIANRDIGFAIARKSAPKEPSSHAVVPPQANQQGVKRAASPGNDYRKNANNREDNNNHNKRARQNSPPPRRDWGDRDRGRRYSPPPPKERAPLPPPRREREEEKPVVLPGVVHWFQSQLPPAAGFDGPVFRTDDLMGLFRGAVIPASQGPARARSPPPPPSRGGGRPGPDYSPYQGPGGGGGGGRGGRRY